MSEHLHNPIPDASWGVEEGKVVATSEASAIVLARGDVGRGDVEKTETKD